VQVISLRSQRIRSCLFTTRIVEEKATADDFDRPQQERIWKLLGRIL
jgi:hypothetical protein